MFRRARIPLIVGAILCTALLAAWYHLNFSTSLLKGVIHGYSHDDDIKDVKPTEAYNGLDDAVNVDTSDTDSSFENAHRLPSADAFKTQHFDRVLALPGLTVREAKRTCNWTAADDVNFMFGDEEDWNQADRSDGEINYRRGLWQDFIRHDLIPYRDIESRFEGRGIVLLAGNTDTLMRTKAVLRALTRLNSTVPIEIHYYGDEMSSDQRQQLEALYPHTYFNDLAGDHNIMLAEWNAFMINYQLKTAAIVNSRWAELLLLDSDNIPVIDPAEMWESPTYKEYRTIFWPDIARTRPRNPAWALTNTHCRMDEYELESGQLLVDKARFWYHVQLAAHLNNDPDRYYDEFLLGDKDTFRFAWYALKTEFGRPDRWLTSVGTKNGDYYCGHSFAQHHPDDGRVAFLHGGLLKTASPKTLRWNRDEKGGMFRHYKRAETDTDPSRIVRCGIQWDSTEYIPNHDPEDRVQSCVDMYDVEARDLNEIAPGFEQTFRDIGGYWAADEPTE